MMERTGLVGEERVGLFVAIALHILLLIVLLLQPTKREDVQPIERMTVNLTDEVGLTSTAPDPVSESAASTAPVLSDAPAPPSEILPVPIERPVERTVERPVERPVARPVERPAPRPVERPTPRRTERARTPAPAPAPSRRAETPRRTETPARTAERSSERPAQPAARTGGASRIGDNFLAGAGDSATSTETRTPASQIGASAKASIASEIARQIKPHWQPPNGPEVEKIVTYVRFQLGTDGKLRGRPTVARQTGVNDTNRAQADRHAEQAIRAVQLAAPFDLPEEYYEAWKTITANLDWRLAQ